MSISRSRAFSLDILQRLYRRNMPLRVGKTGAYRDPHSDGFKLCAAMSLVG